MTKGVVLVPCNKKIDAPEIADIFLKEIVYSMAHHLRLYLIEDLSLYQGFGRG